ncbi:MAG: YidC/Oxa1 family insertase periplasmic-domain containing protein [Pirellulales bacterium]|nr:YidC/Oxa1 family insertase periplasmic-domain containing protein [Pirellulales bacterium]
MTDRPSSSSTAGNFVLFLVLAFGVVLANSYFFHREAPKDADKGKQAAKAEPDKTGKPAKPADDAKKPSAEPPAKDEQSIDEKQPGDEKPAEEPGEPETAPAKDRPEAKPAALPDKPVPAVAGPARWVTLGSADPDGPYRMLVTLTDRGAAVARIELNSPRYPALTDEKGFLAYKGGYLGRVVMEEDKRGRGCPVQVVGEGTPAAKAGMKPGDVITKLAGRPVTGAVSLAEAMTHTKPKQTVEVEVLRDGQSLTLKAQLTRPPMEVIRPEGTDPLSFLLTLARIDQNVLDETVADKDAPKDARPEYVDLELKGLNLRAGTWEIARATREEVEFRCPLPSLGLEVVKNYRLASVPEADRDNPDFRAYHLVLEVSIRNTGEASRDVAYQLDGPTGLPIEGWWYANKVGRSWSAGLRDFVFAFDGETPTMIGCATIADDKLDPAYTNKLIDYVGIDAQYFSSMLMPKKDDPQEIWFAGTQPLRVGPVNKDNPRITDTSCRLRSVVASLEPGKALTHKFEIFAGPKRPAILDQYNLGPLVYYGWFDFVAYPLVKVLHAFHSVVLNWGVAIILLTALVRGAMFPMSRKQVQGAQKMADLQPEMRRLQEKYKKDLAARHKAQQELFRKHGYNPLSGCLVMLVQLPIFVGLYNGLRVDIELRGSSLLGSSVRWCSDLAAPDMLFDWSAFMPQFVTNGLGIFGLGPYFNLLPLATVILFLLQQKMFMPPPADEQQAMQQNIMKYMMLFMGILFFKVAAGLCVYFIASSLWGLAERQLLPKVAKKDDGDAPPPAAKPDRDNGSLSRRKKGNGRKG